MIKDLCFEIIQTCPNNCLFCSSCSSLDKLKMIDIEVFKKVIDHLVKKGGIEEISLSGGEPLLHPYIFEMIKYCKEKGLKVYDQFGTIGDLSKDNPRFGLHEFKKKFGGDYIEFLGEFDYVTNKLMYFIFTKLVPFYRKMIRNKSKKEIENEVKNTK